jgi:hypothetical protein
MTCVRTNTGWKYCLIGVLGGMGLAILKASSAALCNLGTISHLTPNITTTCRFTI